MTTFQDILKSDFLANAGSFNWLDMVIALSLAFILGLFVFMVYKKTFSGVMYSASFGVALLAMTLITTLVILAISSNLVLSLGMVGALSIVRFRAPIKEPLDIAFIFWAIAIGIVLGAGFIPLAVFGSVFIGIILLLFVNRKPGDKPYIVIINCADENSENAAKDVIGKRALKNVVKSKTVSAAGIELTVEVRLKENSTEFVNELVALPGVGNAVLVSYNGEYMG